MADPRFWYPRNNSMVCWDASLPYYGVGICDRLASDIAAEEAAIRNYQAHQACRRSTLTPGPTDRRLFPTPS